MIGCPLCKLGIDLKYMDKHLEMFHGIKDSDIMRWLLDVAERGRK